MTDASVSKPVIKAERRQLVWRFILSFGVIAGTVAAATIVARWMH
jgi:hypothetical protein